MASHMGQNPTLRKLPCMYSYVYSFYRPSNNDECQINNAIATVYGRQTILNVLLEILTFQIIWTEALMFSKLIPNSRLAQ